MDVLLFNDNHFEGFGPFVKQPNDHVQPGHDGQRHGKYVSLNPDNGRMWVGRFYESQLTDDKHPDKSLIEVKDGKQHGVLWAYNNVTYASLVRSPCHEFDLTKAPVMKLSYTFTSSIRPGGGTWADVILADVDIIPRPATQGKMLSNGVSIPNIPVGDRDRQDGCCLILSLLHPTQGPVAKLIQHYYDPAGHQKWEKAFPRQQTTDPNQATAFEIFLSKSRCMWCEEGVVLLDVALTMPLGLSTIFAHFLDQNYHPFTHAKPFGFPLGVERDWTLFSMEALDSFP